MARATFAGLAGAIIACLASPALAQDDEAPPERTTSIIVYGDEPCPPSAEGEIVVCARKPEEERYRIPKALRERKDQRGEMAWGARTEELEDAQRPAFPGSCSPVGNGGQSGCMNQMIREWYQDRRTRSRKP